MSKGGRCLIILDDAWVVEVIDHVKKVFAENKEGYPIMMTTRDRYLTTYANPKLHNLKLLNLNKSFELLVKRVFGKTCPDELVEPGKRIIGSCGGVPLAIVVITGAFRGHPNTNDWLRIQRNVAEHLY